MKLTKDAHEAHSHKCNQCGTVWGHDPRELCKKFAPSDRWCHARDPMAGIFLLIPQASRAYDAAHACPVCGMDQRYTHDPRATPDYLHTGLETRVWLPEDGGDQ